MHTIFYLRRHNMLMDLTDRHLPIEHKKTRQEILPGICGAEWTRTTDSRIFSPMLYHLSYSTLKKWMQN